MAIEDLHPDQDPLEMFLRLVVGRLAWNIHTLSIPRWRALDQAGQDPRPEIAGDVELLLGRLRAAYEAIQEENPPMDDILIGKMTRRAFEAELIERRNILRTFRNAPKNTRAQARNAVEALVAAFPVNKPKPAKVDYLARALPSGW